MSVHQITWLLEIFLLDEKKGWCPFNSCTIIKDESFSNEIYHNNGCMFLKYMCNDGWNLSQRWMYALQCSTNGWKWWIDEILCLHKILGVVKWFTQCTYWSTKWNHWSNVGSHFVRIWSIDVHQVLRFNHGSFLCFYHLHVLSILTPTLLACRHYVICGNVGWSIRKAYCKNALLLCMNAKSR